MMGSVDVLQAVETSLALTKETQMAPRYAPLKGC